MGLVSGACLWACLWGLLVGLVNKGCCAAFRWDLIVGRANSTVCDVVLSACGLCSENGVGINVLHSSVWGLWWCMVLCIELGVMCDMVWSLA